MSMKAPKGTRDIFGVEGDLFAELEQVARRVFSSYHFNEVRTPIFESLDLFSRSLGETSDVVEKEMFTFTDRGERNFALRPEGTAAIVRHFIEQKLSVKGGVHRLFYMGPMFRAERPQAGRYRQFWQIGSEHFGDASPAADADTVLLVGRILKEFGIEDFEVQVNSLGSSKSRKKYRDVLLKYLESKKSSLTEESQRRMNVNPLRVLDSKVDGLKLSDAPVMKDYLDKEDADHYATFLGLLKAGSIKVVENPRLVRGLDYYSRSVFEFVSPHLGAQNALAAGGRYDDLVKQLGGPATPAVGFALGMDRLVTVKNESKKQSENGSSPKNLAFVAPLLDGALQPAFTIAHHLREKGVSVPPVMVKKKLKNILSLAVEIGANWAILIGEDELTQEKATIKNLATREQSSVPLDQVVKTITSSH